MRMKRSHGMAREASKEVFEVYRKQNPNIDPAFLFMTDGYNFRNHEVCAVLGLSQIKKLDKNISIRRENFKYWWDEIYKSEDYLIPEYQKGNSSFSFPIISKSQSACAELKQKLKSNGIEYRPIISGNLLLHPAFKKYKLCTNKEVSNVSILHNNGLYVGNSQFVTKRQIDRLIALMGV
jgi:CDP-6-deoxy-D-xylo-4-hexulose-3-dehydrase